MRRLLSRLSLSQRGSQRRLRRRVLSFRPPDHSESRGEAVLLVWRDLPYWLVVDREFNDFLRAFDGRRPVGDVIDEAAASGDSDSLPRHIAELEGVGILRETEESASPAGRNQPSSPRIANISINVTRRCNLRCRFCYNLTSLQTRGEDELTADEMIGFLKSLAGVLDPRPSLFLLGGEPLLCPDKVLAVARYAGAGFDVVVSTNGSGVTDDFAREARHIGLQVQVSLDGHTPRIHDSMRGPESYARAVQAIETLVRHRVYTIVSMVCLAENLPHLEAFYDLAATLKVNEARVIPLKRLGGAAAGSCQPVPLGRILHEMMSMLARRPEFVSLLGRDCLSIMATQCQAAARVTSCGTGTRTLLLEADGSLYPCLNTSRPEFAFGNVRESGFDFGTAWRSSPQLERVRRETSVEAADNECSTCLVKYWCLGGCHGETYATCGSLAARSPDCEELRKTVIDMMWTLSSRPAWMKATRAASC